IGNVKVSADSVSSENGSGVIAKTGLGLVDVKVDGSVEGKGGDGVDATTGFGSVNVEVGDVPAERNGINAQVNGFVIPPNIVNLPGVGTVNVKAGDVTAEEGFGVRATTGFGLPGLDSLDLNNLDPLALLTGGVTVDVNNVTSEG